MWGIRAQWDSSCGKWRFGFDTAKQINGNLALKKCSTHLVVYAVLLDDLLPEDEIVKLVSRSSNM